MALSRQCARRGGTLDNYYTLGDFSLLMPDREEPSPLS